MGITFTIDKNGVVVSTQKSTGRGRSRSYTNSFSSRKRKLDVKRAKKAESSSAGNPKSANRPRTARQYHPLELVNVDHPLYSLCPESWRAPIETSSSTFTEKKGERSPKSRSKSSKGKKSRRVSQKKGEGKQVRLEGVRPEIALDYMYKRLDELTPIILSGRETQRKQARRTRDFLHSQIRIVRSTHKQRVRLDPVLEDLIRYTLLKQHGATL